MTASPRTGSCDLSQDYPLWLCDVWGVVHNGVVADAKACDALARHRANGGIVILLTNAPRPRGPVARQLQGLKVTGEHYDTIVSSGDVARALLHGNRHKPVYHLGPARDLGLFKGVDLNLTGPERAEIVLCSGLINDETETPDEYQAMLGELAARGIPMICANPDKVVRKGDRLLPCAGALAELYEVFGGKVLMTGKPHAAIYQEAFKKAEQIAGRPVPKGACLAIGDGLGTDIRGAADFGLATLFVTGGIHEIEFGTSDTALFAQKAMAVAPQLKLVRTMSQLHW